MRMCNQSTMPTFGISQWPTTIPKQKIMVLSSEIIEIVARSSDILFVYCIFWTKCWTLVQEGNCWAWRGAGGEGECVLYSPPLGLPLVCVCVCVCEVYKSSAPIPSKHCVGMELRVVLVHSLHFQCEMC